MTALHSQLPCGPKRTPPLHMQHVNICKASLILSLCNLFLKCFSFPNLFCNCNKTASNWSKISVSVYHAVYHNLNDSCIIRGNPKSLKKAGKNVRMFSCSNMHGALFDFPNKYLWSRTVILPSCPLLIPHLWHFFYFFILGCLPFSATGPIFWKSTHDQHHHNLTLQHVRPECYQKIKKRQNRGWKE